LELYTIKYEEFTSKKKIIIKIKLIWIKEIKNKNKELKVKLYIVFFFAYYTKTSIKKFILFKTIKE